MKQSSFLSLCDLFFPLNYIMIPRPKMMKSVELHFVNGTASQNGSRVPRTGRLNWTLQKPGETTAPLAICRHAKRSK